MNIDASVFVAVPERDLYNRYSKHGTSDIWSGYTYLRVHQWENPELYWLALFAHRLCAGHTHAAPAPAQRGGPPLPH